MQKGQVQIILIGILVLAVVAAGAYYFTKPRSGICLQVVTYAKSPLGGECKAFPTPCDVPRFWNKCTPSIISESPQHSPTPTVVTSQTPQPTPVSSPPLDETADWKTHNSGNLGYSFKHPLNFSITSVTSYEKIGPDRYQNFIADYPYLSENAIASISITDLGKKQGENLSSLLDMYMEDRAEYQIITSKNINIINHSAIYLDTLVNNKPSYLIFIETGDSNVAILNITGTSITDDMLKSNINKILTTFKFL